MTTTTPLTTTTKADAETWLHRVTALLAKAESTDFEEERDALFAKAQELMARHAIDDAMLAARGRGASETVESEVVVISAPYASAKSALLGAVACANQCRVVRGSGGAGTQRCVVFGHPADLAGVRTLYAALSVHAVRAMLRAPLPPNDTPRRFRHSFLIAFTSRIGERLRASAASARQEAEATAGPGVGVVLASRSKAVSDAVSLAFPRLRFTRVSSSSSAGASHGRAAADRAGLGQSGLEGTRRALPS